MLITRVLVVNLFQFVLKSFLKLRSVTSLLEVKVNDRETRGKQECATSEIVEIARTL